MPSVDLTGLSVLLVEDEALLRKQLGAVLERLGADVHHASNLASARGLMESLFRKHRLPPRSLSESARQKLLDHPFPGNVRELAHELERAIVFEDTEQLELAQLSKKGSASEEGAGLPAGQWFNEGFVFPQQGFDLEQAILKLIHHALQQTRNNVSAAARLLGVTRDYVRYRLENEGNPAGAGDSQDSQ